MDFKIVFSLLKLESVVSIRLFISLQPVYTDSYPFLFLLLPIRYAINTITTRPARAAPTAMGTTLFVFESPEHWEISERNNENLL